MACGRQFRAGDTMTDKELWTLYQASKQTVAEIAAIAGKSPSTVKRRLRGIDIRWEQPSLEGTNGFVHLDVTYWGRNWGVLLALDDATCRPLYVAFVKHETIADYVKAVETITGMGYVIKGIIIDGMRSLFDTFPQYKIQMCQYHMCAIVRRKITKNPKLSAGQELQQLMRTLKDAREDDFKRDFQNWKDKWKSFLNERTLNPMTKKTYYTHQRTRSAMLSIEFYLPYLFTYQHVDGMPNTNNKIEGTFTDLKKNLDNHSGMTKENRKRFVNGFFLALAETPGMKKQEPR